MATNLSPTESDSDHSLNQSYLAKQLPYLQERAPIVVNNELLEIPSNAPPTVPPPPLFPGEVLRMQQHRAVCAELFSEPLVGVVYLTNFRVIFNGTPITAPDMYDIVRDMHTAVANSRSSDAGLNDTSTIFSAGSSSTVRSFRKQKFAPTSQRQPKFYIGEGDHDDGIAEVENETGGVESLHSKVMKKITTLKKSVDKNNSKTDSLPRQHLNRRVSTPDGKPVDISLPLSRPSNSHESLLSTSAPNNNQEEPQTLLPDKPQTLPRPLKPTEQASQPMESYKTNDSGFSDPSLPKPDSIEKELCKADVFNLSNSYHHRPVSRQKYITRPGSLLDVDSDTSDSDTATDKLFGSIVEYDETSDCETPPPYDYHGNVFQPRTLSLKSLQNDESHPLRDSYLGRKPSNDLSVDKPHPLIDGSKPLTTNLRPLVKDNDPFKPRPLVEDNDPFKPHPPVESDHPSRPHPPTESIESSTSSKPYTPTEDDELPCTKPRPPMSRFNPSLPKKPPRRRKNKFQQKDSLDSSDMSKDEETSSSEHSPLLSPTTDELNVLVKSKSRRNPPPPPPLPHITMETSTEHLTVSTNPDFIDSRSSSVVGNCSSASSLTKRFSLAANNPYNTYSNWAQSVDKKALCNTWSDPRVNSTSSIMTPYGQYTHSTSIPLSSLHIVKILSAFFIDSVGLKMPDGVLLASRTCASMKLYLHPMNTFDSSKLKELLDITLAYQKPLYNYFAFKYRSAIKLPNPQIFDSRKLSNFFSFEAEIERQGILSAKVDNSNIWRVTDVIKTNPELCRSYPDKLVVLLCTPDMDLIRGANVYQEGRFPTACWMDCDTQSVLLRAAATISERGQQGAKLPVDEAILHAIRTCNKNGRLFVFTEKSEEFVFQDPTKLTTDAARSYYYHNCNFVFSVNPPTFKSVRHSFNKLQAMVMNNIPDYDYLCALDNTKWLSRISELLETATKVCVALKDEQAHVLVCYESGWDRTTQISSLTQLLCDPFYRTMEGFQILIQKEWVWFGHPFGFRNGFQRAKIKNDAPVFLQWLDCVYQVMHQAPLAFEFNENLLLALVEHCYSDLFGTFLMNSERERQQCFMVPDHYHQSVDRNTVSLWTWVSMMNATNRIFYNPLYNKDFHTGVIYPKYYQTCLVLWRNCFEKDKGAIEDSYDSFRVELNQLLRLLSDRLGDCITSSDCHNTARNARGQSPVSTSTPVYTKAVTRTKSDRSYSSIVDYLCKEGYDPSICHHITISGKTCQGYLVKEGGVMKTWKKRWFVLDYRNEYFTYFETMEHFLRNENPKGVIILDQIKKVSLSTKREHLLSNLFQVKTPNRIYSIRAPSIISMEIWMACLKLPASSLK